MLVTRHGVWMDYWIYLKRYGLLTTNNHNSLTDLHTLQITTVHIKFSRSAVSSLVVAWQQFLTVKVPLLPFLRLTTNCNCRRWITTVCPVWSGNFRYQIQPFRVLRGPWPCFSISPLWLSRLTNSSGPVTLFGSVKLLLILTSPFILGSGSRGTHDHICLMTLGVVICCWPSLRSSGNFLRLCHSDF
jgi:hypothetical protein